MPRKPSTRPTDAELAILRILWDHGACTVKDVHRRLKHRDKIGYTTVLKTLQIMTEKNLVKRDESQRAHIYSPRRTEEQTQKHMLRDLLDRAYKGSAGKLVLQALSSKPATEKEIEEIRNLLDKISGEE